MSINDVTAGKHLPDEFNVIIEIPMNADPIKYEVDKNSGALFVDRFMMTAMHYPANYGYVPRTIAADNDPVDVLVGGEDRRQLIGAAGHDIEHPGWEIRRGAHLAQEHRRYGTGFAG